MPVEIVRKLLIEDYSIISVSTNLYVALIPTFKLAAFLLQLIHNISHG